MTKTAQEKKTKTDTSVPRLQALYGEKIRAELQILLLVALLVKEVILLACIQPLRSERNSFSRK